MKTATKTATKNKQVQVPKSWGNFVKTLPKLPPFEMRLLNKTWIVRACKFRSYANAPLTIFRLVDKKNPQQLAGRQYIVVDNKTGALRLQSDASIIFSIRNGKLTFRKEAK